MKPVQSRARYIMPPSRHVEILRSCGAGFVLLAVCNHHHVEAEALLGRGRSHRLALARQELYWHLHVEWQWSSVEVGAMVGRDHATVLEGAAKHQRRIEAA